MRGKDIRFEIRSFLCNQPKGSLNSPNQLHSKLSGWHDPYRTIRPYLEDLNGARCRNGKKIVITNKGWAYVDDPVQDEELLAETKCESLVNFARWVEDGVRSSARDLGLPSPDIVFHETLGLKPLSEVLMSRGLCEAKSP